MKYIQGLLLIIGSLCLGTALGFYALVAVAVSMQKPTTEPWQNAYGQYMSGLFCGVPLGALCGLAVAIAFMGRRWSGWVWLGILLGLVCGPFACYWLHVERGFGWYGIALLTVACATAGGLIAGAVITLRDSR